MNTNDTKDEQLSQVPQERKQQSAERIALTPAGEARVAVGSGAGPTWAQRQQQGAQE